MSALREGIEELKLIPLPSRRTDISTTAIHHHGDLMLTTCCVFGPG